MNSNPTLDSVVQEEQRSIMQMIKEFATLSRMLRIIGAFSVVASMSLFLLQGWDTANDLDRYYLLLSQTVLLTIGGFSLSFLLKENKGARVFFGLSLISIAANLTTLGALVQSFYGKSINAIDYPGIAFWSVSNGASVTIALLIAAAVLIPTALFGFKIMARRSASYLTTVYIMSGSLILLPVRDTMIVAIMAGIVIVLSLLFVTSLKRVDPTLKTPEGVFARLLIFIPPVIMLVRSIWLYEPEHVFFSIMSATLFLILRHCSLEFSDRNVIRKIMELFSMPVALVTALSVTQLMDNVLPNEYTLPIFASLFLLQMLELAYRSKGFRSAFLLFSTSLTSLCFLASLAIEPTLFMGLLCIIAGIVIMIIALMYRYKIIMNIGFVTLVVAILFEMINLYQMIDLFNWTSLAVFGALAIITASIIERHGVSLKAKLTNWVRIVQFNTDVE